MWTSTSFVLGFIKDADAWPTTPYQQDKAKALVRLAIEAPAGPPKTEVELVDRLTVNALRELWAGHPAELRLIEIEAADSPRYAVLASLGAGVRNFFGDTYGL
ncbi:hypothetical protein [Nocardia fluminea]|uniref:hypothetical protein n=1 Tax=Nocardia fluminea TaxID=134984 RepID=UPI0036555F6F